MPDIYIISAGMISATDKNGNATSLGSRNQGDGSHLGTVSIDPNADFTRIQVDEESGRSDYLEDTSGGRSSGQELARGVRIDGVRYRRGTDIENEYRITLQDSSGKTYNAWAIEIEDGRGADYDNVVGYAFARGQVPPFGETLQVVSNMDLVNQPNNNTNEFMYSAGVTCFTAGTLVDTPTGQIPVEALRAGMKVWTLDNGPQEIVWTGQRDLDWSDLQCAPHLKPVVIQAGAMGNERALSVSRQHRLALPENDTSSGGEARRFARAVLLADRPGMKLRLAHGCRRVSYVHFMCASHQIVRTEGLLSETFYPGPQALAALDPCAKAEVLALFPGLLETDGDMTAASRAYGALARMEVSKRTLEASLA